MRMEVNRTRVKLTSVEGDLDVRDGEVEAVNGQLRVSGTIFSRGISRFIGDVIAESYNAQNGDTVITGNFTAGKRIESEGSISVEGNLKTDILNVKRRLHVGGSLESYDIDIGGSVDVGGSSKSYKVDVGGSLRSDSSMEVNRLDVGGSVDIKGDFTAERMDVGGSFIGRGRVKADDVDVGGSFEAQSEVEIGNLDVGGTIILGGG